MQTWHKTMYIGVERHILHSNLHFLGAMLSTEKKDVCRPNQFTTIATPSPKIAMHVITIVIWALERTSTRKITIIFIEFIS